MPPKFTPPSRWRRLYSRLEDFRKELVAPVDTVGCHCLKDKNAPMETQRYHTLVALMLSAQTKDAVTAVAMKNLIAVGLTPESVSAMPAAVFDRYIGKVGFHNVKTKHIKEVADILLKDYGGRVPREYEQLIALPGVGPKMAHLFLQDADGVVLGIGVDTHVHRISQRFRWVPTTVKTPEDTRRALESWLPQEHWSTVNHLLVGLGQTICTPLGPKCAECKLNDICPNAFLGKVRVAKTARQTPKRSRKGPGSDGEESLSDIEDIAIPAKWRRRSVSASPNAARKENRKTK